MTQAPLTGTVEVEGLSAVLSAFGHIDKSLSRELRGELRHVADKAAQMAEFIANEKGLQETGKLLASIHAGTRASYAYITATAKRVSPAYPAGFNYPALYEYGGSETRRAHGADFKIRNRSLAGVRLIANHGIGTGHLGARAFLEPAAQQGEPYLEEQVGNLLDRLISEAGLGNGGQL